VVVTPAQQSNYGKNYYNSNNCKAGRVSLYLLVFLRKKFTKYRMKKSCY